MRRICPTCRGVGENCHDCHGSGTHEIYEVVQRDFWLRYRQLLIEYQIASPQDLDPHGRWLP